MGVPVDDFECASLASLVHLPVEQHSRPADDCIQRCAQFVREGRQELVLCTVGGLGFAPSGRFTQQQLLPFALCVSLRGQITHKPGESGGIVAGHPCDGDFHREFPPVRMAGGGFNATFDEWSVTGGDVPGQTSAMAVAKFSRNQQVGQLSTERVRLGVSERALRRGVELGDPSLVIHSNDRVKSRIQDGVSAALTVHDRGLHALAAHELSNLIPDGRHCPE